MALAATQGQLADGKDYLLTDLPDDQSNIPSDQRFTVVAGTYKKQTL